MDSKLDISTVELTRTCLRLIPELRFLPQRYGDETWYHVEVPSTSQFHRMGYAEYAFVSLLDGHTSFSQALAISAQVLGDAALSQTRAMVVYQWLLDKGLAHFADGELNPDRSRSNERTAKSGKSVLSRLNPLWLRIPLGRPEPVLKALAPVFGWVFSMPATVAGILVAMVSATVLCSEWNRFSDATAAVFAPDNWLWLLVAWISLKIVHEIGHGLVCLRYGGTVREMGIVVAFFAPLAFVDATSCWAFRSRFHRIHAAAAGMYIELLIASAAVIGWSRCDSAVAGQILHNVIIMASVSTLLFNINPLMKFDGYYILSDLLNIPNLATESSTELSRILGRLVFGDSGSAPGVVGRRRWLLLTYAVAALCWRMLVCISLLIAASVLFHGAGVVLAAVGVAAWFGPMLRKLLKLLQTTHQSGPARLVRAGLVSGTALGGVGTLLLLLPAPVMSTAPGIVEYKDGQIVRALTSGFVRHVHVRDGQTVQTGELLLELRNEEIDREFDDVVLMIRQEEIRLQRATRECDSGAISISRGNLQSLEKKFADAFKRQEGLLVRAGTTGQIVSRNLERMSGTYLEEGQELLTIGLEDQKELRLSIGQAELQTALPWCRHELPIRVGTRSLVAGTLQRINPRASRTLPHPAMSATSGGPLAVVENDDTNESTKSRNPLRLTEHRFDGVVALGPEQSRMLRCGERATVSFGIPDGSLAVHLYRSGHRWLQAQLDNAANPN